MKLTVVFHLRLCAVKQQGQVSETGYLSDSELLLFGDVVSQFCVTAEHRRQLHLDLNQRDTQRLKRTSTSTRTNFSNCRINFRAVNINLVIWSKSYFLITEFSLFIILNLFKI